MFARTLGMAVLGIVVVVLGVHAGRGAKDKDTPKDKKFEVPKDAMACKVKSVDLKEASFTVTFKNNKQRTFAVDAKTEFWGPKGGDRGTGTRRLSVLDQAGGRLRGWCRNHGGRARRAPRRARAGDRAKR